MTIAELRTLADADAASNEPKRMMAGKYAKKALDQLDARDWKGAMHYLLQAATRRPESYVPAIVLVERCRIGSETSPAKTRASRENGKKGGRPRKKVEEERDGPDSDYFPAILPSDFHRNGDLMPCPKCGAAPRMRNGVVYCPNCSPRKGGTPRKKASAGKGGPHAKD